MKEKLVFYRLITFILLPIAGLNAISLISLLPALLGNPLLLIAAFIQFAIVAYTFASFIFFTKGVLNGKVLRPVLKDWIKLNGVITIVFAGLALFMVLMLLLAMVGMGAGKFEKLMTDTMEKMKGNGMVMADSARDLARQLTFSSLFVTFYTGALLAHVIITFKLLKKYVALFGGTTNPPGNEDLL